MARIKELIYDSRNRTLHICHSPTLTAALKKYPQVPLLAGTGKHGNQKPHDGIYWKKSLPLFLNSRGSLLHRVKSVFTFIEWDFGHIALRHDAVHYLCGNSTTAPGTFFAEPPKVGIHSSRLVCAACEAVAIATGRGSIDELTGRHCHVGKLRAHRTCCQNLEN